MLARFLACTLLLFALGSHARGARAEEDPRAAAAAHFKRGLEHAKGDAFAEALAEFEAAYRLVQHEATLYNIALAQAGLGRRTDAVLTLRRYLASPPEPKSATKRKAASALLEKLLAELGTSERTRAEPAASAQLTVVVFPYGQVWIDGQLAGSSPSHQSVSAGAHRIAGGRGDEPEQSFEVVLEAGASRRLVLPWARRELVPSSDLPPSAASPSQAPAPPAD